MSRYDRQKKAQESAKQVPPEPSAEELFAIANEVSTEKGRGGLDRILEGSAGNRSPVLTQTDGGGTELLSVAEDGVEEDVYQYSPKDTFIQVIKYLLLDLSISDLEDRKDKAERLFKRLNLLALGQGVHLLDKLPQALEFALQHGMFQVTGAPQDRGEQHDDRNHKDNRLLIELLGNDIFNRLNDRARGYQCSPRSAFIYGIDHALAANMFG